MDGGNVPARRASEKLRRDGRREVDETTSWRVYVVRSKEVGCCLHIRIEIPVQWREGRITVAIQHIRTSYLCPGVRSSR
jgi:hypothetical protein